MGKYNLDAYIERRGSDCIKFDWAKEHGYEDDIMPLWVADMDFETVPEVSRAICERTKHGIYGYTLPKEDYWDTVIKWLSKHFGFTPKKEWGFYTPGVVFALSSAIRSFTKEGDAVMILRPVYHPFTKMVEKNHRELVISPLKLVETMSGFHYEMDYEDFETKIIDNKVKLFLLCNPHNPGGRVWTREELIRIGDICVRHNVIVVSDEIHADFAFAPHKHTVFASIKEEFLNCTVTCTSPTKTFNLAGLQISNIFCANEAMRNQMIEDIMNTGYDEPNIFGIVACKAAYEYGEEWLIEVKQYIQDNMQYVKEVLAKNLPKVKMMDAEGTYLAWMDFSAYQLTEQEIEELMVKKAKLWLVTGTTFGPEGLGFKRINVATSRAYLEKAMNSLCETFKDL